MEATREPHKRRIGVPAWLALYLLAPFFGEVVSGSTTPIELANVIGAVFLAFLYGGGALLIREAKVRLNKGWSFVFVWGCAYGILEEGLCCKSFFDPKWPDIDSLGVYGRFAGVNWVWVFFLIVFHALVSIMLPIYLSERIYRDKSKDSWVNKQGIIAAAALLALVVFAGYHFFPDGKHVYYPPAVMVEGSLAAIMVLLLVGFALPKNETPKTISYRPKALVFLGFVSYTLFAVCMFGFPKSIFNPLQAIVISLVLFAAVFMHARRCWSFDDPNASLAAFLKGLFISFSLWLVLVDMKSGFLTGSILVPLALLMLYRRQRKLTMHSKIA